jgi:hypothetical protein
MSILLFIVGGIAVIVGILLAGFGIPVSEFSFGNTLISAGATTAVGGLIVIGLGAAVSKLQQIADSLATQLPAGVRPMETFEAPGLRAAPVGRIPFPPKAKSAERPATEPSVASAPELSIEAEPLPAPTLRNPDVPPVTVDEAVTLSPPASLGSAPAAAELGGMVGRTATPAEDRSARQTTSYFDAMWPAEKKPVKAEAPPEPTLDLPPEEATAQPAAEPSSEKPHAAAVLKSGVVDGMGYTLYVDGSIEAELPQGTLRFASINELRSHLEKNA